MGKRSSTETIVAIVQAFLEKRTWSQAELARHVDVQVPALRRRLVELTTSGFPLQREDDHPHVYWSVAKGWFPGAVIFGSEDIVELARQLRRLPHSVGRERLMRRIADAAPRGAVARDGSAVVAPRASETEESYLPLAEDAATRQLTLSFTYFTASRGALEKRHASVQRVVIGPPARLLAVCHRDGALKWFRLDNVLAARLDEGVPFRGAAPALVEGVLRESVDGFHQGIAAVRCAFFVRAPESSWVARNLPGALTSETVVGGLRFETTTAGVLRLARFVVGLGAAARAETPELGLVVRELARGALDSGPLDQPA